MQIKFEKAGFMAPEILLPKDGADMGAWAVVACDQYTSQPDYWEDVASLVGDNPSTLHMIVPEVYLETEKEKELLGTINGTMKRYLDEGVLASRGNGFLLVDRKTAHVPSRKGLVVALDLECYDYNQGATTLIRATEGTILDRLPPRIKVREGAPIELPHIMVLIDDPDRTVIEPLFEKDLEKAYDFELMKGSGHITGYMVNREEDVAQVASALEKLGSQDAFEDRYSILGKPPLLYAMGDGNHSFATAKAIWERIKDAATDKDAVMDHPARYALVELVNIHDKGLEFEPIHRVVFGVDPALVVDGMQSYYRARGLQFSIETLSDEAEQRRLTAPPVNNDEGHCIPFIAADRCGLLTVSNPEKSLVVATLQDFLDDFLAKNKDAKIDYVHGENIVCELGEKDGNIGFLLPAIDKHSFFRTIILDGALPRKTFSMGEADEKRFYLECRRIAQ